MVVLRIAWLVILALGKMVMAMDSENQVMVMTMEHNNLEEGSGVEESSDSNTNYRGDNIAVDYSDDDFSHIPLHNIFEDDDNYDDGEEVCDQPICWTVCAGAETELSMVCSCCPVKRPVKMEDINLSVSCDTSGAVVGYNLSSVMQFGLEDVSVVVSYKIEGEDDTIAGYEVEDYEGVEYSWPGLCSGVQYQFCMTVEHSNMSKLDKPLCKVGENM